MAEFASISGYLGAGAFALLTLLLIGAHSGSWVGRTLIFASIASTIWLGAIGNYYAAGAMEQIALATILELIRNLAWVAFAICILLRNRESGEEARGYRTRLFLIGSLAFGGSVAIACIQISPSLLDSLELHPWRLSKLAYLSHLSLAVLGLWFAEQVYRNTHPSSRWAIKHICIGLGALFAYDIYLYAEAVLFNRISPDVWAARGIVNAMAVPFIALSARRNADWELRVFVSRQVVFHSTAIVAVGLYLLIMSAAGFYLKTYGGDWGGALRTVFWFGSALFLVAVVFSAEIRARLRQYLTKHFYQNKYDYGEVWLGLTDKLSSTDGSARDLFDTSTQAVADILDSTGGMFWYKDEDGNFSLSPDPTLANNGPDLILKDDLFINKLQREKAVIDLHHVASTVSTQDNVVPQFLLGLPRAWIIVPVLHGDELLAFVVLADSRSGAEISWEDRELLRTVGSQIGSYIALLKTTDDLAELKQFDAFNRLSAFLVHDLKNVVAQLSLIVKNSEKFRHEPDFIDDAFTTVDDAVSKMTRMLNNLKQGHAVFNENEDVDLSRVITEAIGRCGHLEPSPKIMPFDESILVTADYNALTTVLEHLVQNAQEATAEDGSIEIRVVSEIENTEIQISDTGSGMSPEFIKERLFKPFDTTKGKAGMGIGVYESRQLINEMGGYLTVESQVNIGTTFTIRLPHRVEIDKSTPQLRVAN